jgi:hypothetical protein
MGAGVMFMGELRQGAQLLSEALETLEGRTDALSIAILSGLPRDHVRAPRRVR